MDIIREDCIYARQSVDRKDSISIESQIDFCKYELKGGSCKVFKDKGYSGKNTDRPEFQKLLGEIRKGRVRRVIVYKLDRISRSILDFANMMELFQEYDVEFVSSTEKLYWNCLCRNSHYHCLQYAGQHQPFHGRQQNTVDFSGDFFGAEYCFGSGVCGSAAHGRGRSGLCYCSGTGGFRSGLLLLCAEKV